MRLRIDFFLHLLYLSFICLIQNLLCLLMSNHSTPLPPIIWWSLIYAVLDAVWVFVLSERLMEA